MVRRYIWVRHGTFATSEREPERMIKVPNSLYHLMLDSLAYAALSCTKSSEYVNFEQLTEPMIAKVYVEVQWEDSRGQRDLDPREKMYVDLHDRANWRE